MRQVPIGPDNLICPLHKKKMADVCHKCPWWQCLRGKNPQSNEDIDRWDCAIAMLPMLMVENAQMVRQGTATMADFRNTVVGQRERIAAAVASQQQVRELTADDGRRDDRLAAPERGRLPEVAGG